MRSGHNKKEKNEREEKVRKVKTNNKLLMGRLWSINKQTMKENEDKNDNE